MIKMEGLGGGGGGILDDMGEGMQCSDHPYRNNPGGICAFCLQEKLGKLVSSSSSSFPISMPLHFPPSSSSSSPSFRSDFGGVSQSHGDANGNRSISSSSSNHNTNTTAGNSYITCSNKKITNGGRSSSSKGGHGHYHEFSSRRARIPFLLTPKKKKKKVVESSSITPNVNSNFTLKRNQSTRTPRRGHFMDDDDDGDDEYEYSSPHRRWFWSFLYHSKSTTTTTTTTKRSTTTTTTTTTTETIASAQKAKMKTGLESKADLVVVDESESPSNHAASFGRKVSRSRSVGCGSRSFSGDFFERISTGFGDCGTLRRVESHREGKPKVGSTTAAAAAAMHCKSDHHHQCIKERVKCGGIFGGFMMTSSSSSSSSSSYWVSSAEEINGGKSAVGPLVQGRSKSWGWAFASPIRAFSRTSSKVDGKHNVTTHSASNNSTTATPNLAVIPSLLTARS